MKPSAGADFSDRISKCARYERLLITWKPPRPLAVSYNNDNQEHGQDLKFMDMKQGIQMRALHKYFGEHQAL